MDTNGGRKKRRSKGSSSRYPHGGARDEFGDEKLFEGENGNDEQLEAIWDEMLDGFSSSRARLPPFFYALALLTAYIFIIATLVLVIIICNDASKMQHEVDQISEALDDFALALQLIINQTSMPPSPSPLARNAGTNDFSADPGESVMDKGTNNLLYQTNNIYDNIYEKRRNAPLSPKDGESSTHPMVEKLRKFLMEYGEKHSNNTEATTRNVFSKRSDGASSGQSKRMNTRGIIEESLYDQSAPNPEFLTGGIAWGLADFYEDYKWRFHCSAETDVLPVFDVDDIDDPEYFANVSLACGVKHANYLLDFFFWIISEL